MPLLKDRLVLQKELKALVDEFQLQQDLFYQGPEKGQQTKELAAKMVETAATILKMAEENHYLHLFPPFFVEEAQAFASIARKTNSTSSKTHDSARYIDRKTHQEMTEKVYGKFLY